LEKEEMAIRDSTGDKFTVNCKILRFPGTTSPLTITNQGYIIQVSNILMAVNFNSNILPNAVRLF